MQVPSKLQSSYKELFYPHDSYLATDIGYIAARAQLLGYKAPPLANSYVLELGCASGANTLAQALKYPDTNFIGVDLCKEQIEQAQLDAKRLAIKNIEFICASFSDLIFEQKFSYIIAHGLYSWIAPNLAPILLECTHNYLTTAGIAYISFNSLPGWYAQKGWRDLLLMHTEKDRQAQSKLSSARNLLDLYANHATTGNFYRQRLMHEWEILQHLPDGYLYHDHLEVFNTPYYIKDFIEAVELTNLHYLGDINSENIGQLDKPAQEFIKSIESEKLKLQYLDHFTARNFRQSLVARRARIKDFNPQLILNRFSYKLRWQLATTVGKYEAQALAMLELSFNDGEKFQQIIIKDAAQVAIIKQFIINPSTLIAGEKFQFSAQALLDLLELGIINAYSLTPKMLLASGKIANKPHVWQGARYFAKHYPQFPNLFLENVSLDKIATYLLLCCDGTYAISQLEQKLLNELLTLKLGDDFLDIKIKTASLEQLTELVAFYIIDALDQFRNMSLLV